ncbi:MAG: phage virion morphogenesis protein [Deltaproteobacteria bacterium]|nr:phage virion morphogenesis protein [Deltaproteobacteria bacterium]
MMTLEWSLNPETLAKALTRRREHLARMAVFHAGVSQSLLQWAQDNMANQGGFSESGWPPLAPATLAAKRRRGWPAAPLEATGRLRRGFATTVDAQAARLKNSVPYAAHHQQGLGVPRRPILPSPAQAEELAQQTLRNFLREALK